MKFLQYKKIKIADKTYLADVYLMSDKTIMYDIYTDTFFYQVKFKDEITDIRELCDKDDNRDYRIIRLNKRCWPNYRFRLQNELKEGYTNEDIKKFFESEEVYQDFVRENADEHWLYELFASSCEKHSFI